MHPPTTDTVTARDILALFSILDLVSYGNSLPPDMGEPESERLLSEHGLDQVWSIRALLGGHCSYHAVFSAPNERARQTVKIVCGQDPRELDALKAQAENALAEIVSATRTASFGSSGVAILVSGSAAMILAIVRAIGSILDEAGHSAGKLLLGTMPDSLGEAELVRLMVTGGSSVALRVFKPVLQA